MENALNPGRVFGMLTAYQQTDALATAVELDLFTAIADGHTTAASLSQKTGASERGIRILADFFGAHGLLAKSGNEYSLTPESAAFLNRHSPGYMGGLTGFVCAPHIRRQFSALTQAVRQGGVAVDPEGSTADSYAGWVDFANSMAAMMSPAAHQIARLVPATPIRVLDVAASHGTFGFTIARHNPHAHITALDWANVLSVTTANAHAHGLADRFSTIAGDAFKVDLGGPYDIILLTNLLHHFDQAAVTALCTRMKSALAPGGKVITLEFIPNEDRITPPHAATFPLVMLASTPSGDAYTPSEYREMFTAAGLPSNEFIPVPGTPQTIIISQA